MPYFDNSATTPVDERVLSAMLPYYRDKYGNPSSSHKLGQVANQALSEAREKIAKLFKVHSSQVVFTSGATEANNLALKGLASKEIIVSQIEHPSVLVTADQISKQTGARVIKLKPTKDGHITADSVSKAITKRTKLVSIMFANNETGAIQPIKKIGEVIQKENKKRAKKNRIFFHTDAVQALNYLECDFKSLPVDLLSLSGHKIYGPKGIGLLLSSEDAPLEPQITGGHQELELRAGTENLAGIIGLAKAIEISKKEQKTNYQKVKEIRDYFEKKLKNEISNIVINSEKTDRTPHISNVSFEKAEGESILLALDLAGIQVSTGSACASAEHSPSYVLTSMGVKPELAQGAVRFSFGKHNTKAEIDQLITALKAIVEKLRKISPTNL